nr:MFS transporter [Nocardia anaemiae]
MFAWSRGFYGYYNLVFITIIYALTVGMFVTLGMNVPLMAKELGWSAAEYGAGSSIYLISVGVASFVAGLLIPRVGARRLMVCFTPLVPLAVLGMSLVQHAWQLYLCTGVLGIGSGCGVVRTGDRQ